MATGDRGGAATQPVPLRSENAPIQPLRPPHPALQAAGFQGSVDEFNQKVPQIVNAYRAAHGTNPPPGLVLDVARSPVSVQQYNSLFDPAFLNPSLARLRGSLVQHDAANPTTVRPDGTIVAHTPLTRQLAGVTTSQNLAAKYPWVPHEAGYLPVKNFGAAVDAAKALTGAGAAEQQGQLTIGGKTLAEYEKETLMAGAATPGDINQLGKNAFKAMTVDDAVHTMKDVQQQLQDRFPAYFKDLPVSGNISSDWVHAIGRFQNSATYYQAATEQLARDNHFNTPAAFEKAWNRKNEAIKAQPLAANALVRTPLAFFGDGASVLNYISGDNRGWGWINTPTVALHTVAGLAKTVFVGAAALSAGVKSDTAAFGEFLNKIAPHYLGGKGYGLKEAEAEALRVARENPTWMRALFPDMPAEKDQPAWLKATNQFTNFVLDVVVGNKLVVGGSAVRIGDEAALASNRYAKSAIPLAFNGMKNRGLEGVGEASRLIQGGETLNVQAAEAIKNGDMTLAQYQQHVADLYHRGRTELNGETLIATRPADTVLTTLREKNLPNPALAHLKIKSALDSFEQSVRDSSLRGTSNAANMWQAVRQQFARAAPTRARIYDPKAPDDLYNWVITHLHDRELAYKARNDLVVARAKDDIPAIQDLNNSLLERYTKENPNLRGRPASPLASEGPGIEAESQSYLKLLSGRQPVPLGPLDKLEQAAVRMNGRLNAAGAWQREIIIGMPGTGESLFYKHGFADTARRFAGGGGLRFGLSKTQRLAREDLRAHFLANPADLREFSYNRAQAEMGEAHYIRWNRAEDVASFNTADPAFQSARHVEAAGGYLRRMLEDNALTAYKASSKVDKSPLFDYVWHSKFYQNKIAASEDFKQEAATLKASIAEGKWRTAALSDLKKRYAQDWADGLFKRYKTIEDAGAQAGVPDFLNQAQQVAIEHAGAHADEQLGKLIKTKQVGFDVKDAPVRTTTFDSWTQKWIGTLMTFNKLNRRVFFDHIFYNTYDELLRGGWEKPEAIAASMQLAKAQTVYHMLDFSNMLQVEQNLRWVSFFATKHRLYWTWIGRQFLHKPLLAAAVDDVGKHLQNGNVNFTIHGHSLRIPVARLFWINQTEYPETTSIVAVGAKTLVNLAHHPGLSAATDALSQEVATSGNVLTREDQTVMGLAKYVKALAVGGVTYGAAIDGMSPTQRRTFNQEMHNYVLSFRAHHNGRYPTEQDAVKATLWRATALEGWRANLFVPMLLNTGPSTEIQKLHQQFDKITDPAKRMEFLDKNPKLQDSFGASGDQALYLHNQPLWDQFRQATARRDDAMKTLRDLIDQQGFSAALAKQVKAVSKQYREDIQRIRVLDAHTWAGNATYPAGKVADNGEVMVTGPWSQRLDGDPAAANAFLHEMFPGVSKAEFTAHTLGQTVQDLQAEVARINQLGWQKLGYPDERHAKDRISQIENTVATLQSLPKNPTSQMVSAYYSRFVDPYIKMRDKLKTLRASTSSADKNQVYALTRAIQERYDHPVTVIDPVNGKKDTFPSPVSFGFTMLPPDEYRTALAGAISGKWEDITGYEKTLLGIKTPPNVAEGWAAYQQTVNEYGRVPNNPPLVQAQRVGLAKQIDKVYPGFYKDFLFSQEPKVRRFESTSLYRTMPDQLRVQFNQAVGQPAQKVAAAIKANGHSTYYLRWWRNYIREQVIPWLNNEPQLKDELNRYGPDFLNTLPTAD